MEEGFVTDAWDIPPGTWSNRIETAPPLTLERLREGIQLWEQLERSYLTDPDSWFLLDEVTGGADNVMGELLALARQGDETGFRELAGCVMPAGEVDECWAGTRVRLGLTDAPRQAPQFYSRSIVEMLGEGA